MLSGVTFEKDGKTEKGSKMVGENPNKVEVVVEKQINNNFNKNNSEKQKSYKSLFFFWIKFGFLNYILKLI